ncbi:MAG: amino acid adenylation domain-containing protein, partial [Candidatus Aminicenantes bacterium]|nr:amino acid adenylation domain-containing protein [Candidatus Aminicenantes bacterium]NIM81634.1 amino acid adenylation domain-containing protein [Candidatus Aminicenantes bacterium]NIN21004.1 amino acid adenylation domain-containing protein [Candidatus Aminicenantes bacterium]NIN44825.1 amino acid adenylation domain-containing protein [Candidatus Aminicenantes bacterium]NIN87633.1 amino acid adenylation domain-containing protein [Candidatus Aminicenantes bacterium]
ISRRAIMDSVGLAYHQLPDTLPFDKSFTLKCQSDFFNQYFMSRERLLHVLLHQLQLLTEDEILQKYDSYLPMDIKSLQGLLEFLGLSGDELGEFAGVEEDFGRVPGLQEKMKRFFPVRVPAENALKVLLLDLSQFFKGENPMLYDVVEPPLGLMYLLTYLYQQFGNKVKGKIAKSRIDFNSFEELKALLGEFQPDVIGIRTLSFYKDFFHQAVSLMRHWGWSVPIIAGGPYATSDYMNIAQDPNIDLVVLGEGELTFSELIGKIMENGGVLPDEGILKEIPGIAVVPCKRHSHRCFEYDRGREIILMDEIPGHEHKQPTIESTGNVTTVDKPGDLAYIIYTSGTTGNPKGVMIEHKNVVRLMINDKFPFDFSSSDVWTMFHSSSFDFSVWEMYGALLYGGKLIVIPEMVTVDFERYLQVLKEEGVSVLNQTPSAFYNLAAVEMKYPGRELKLKYVIFGGEALSPVKLKKWKEIYPGTKLINMFGITETTVHVTYKEITDEDILLIRSNIGRPIPTLRTYVMDKNLELLPVGAAGELWVGGDGVGRGYLNRPGLTGERFIPDPFKPGEKLYRSGDLVRLWENGEMEYIGRLDHQVKIRGYRIELGEIEAQLLKHKEIIGAVIVSKEDKSGDKYLCAYFISENKIESAELRNHLSRHLPGYVIPSYFMQLDSIPLTANGKIDLRRLPAPEVEADGDYRAPADEVEETLAEVWADVLNLKKEVISVDANFFELGGHSLKTAVLIAKIFKELHVKVPFINVFETPTIRGLARYIRFAEKDTFESVEPVEKKEYYAASASQKRLYLLQQMKKNSTGYNVPQAVKLEGEPDISGLGSIFTEMIRRHDSLRTSFYMIGEQVVQKVHDNVDFQIEYINPGSPGNPAPLVQEFICSFDLSKAPLLRVRLCRQEEFKHLLIVDMHHIITDGTSMGVFIKDVFALYRGDRLPHLRIQYKDFSEWQNKLFESGEIENQEKYWLKEFEKEIPVLNFPTDFPVPLTYSYEGDSIPFKLNARLVKELRQLALRENCTLYIVLLTIFNIFLFELSGQGDIIVGAPLAGRRHSDLDQVVGFFINLLPLRNFPSDDKTCKEFLNEVSKQVLTAFDNQDYPFDDLVEKVTRQRIPGRNPLVDVIFWLQNFEIAGKQKEKKSSLAVTPYMYQYRAAKYHLMLGCWESRENLSLVFEYNTKLFKKERIRKMADDFIQLVEVILGDINVPIGELQLECRPALEENPLTDLQFNI